MKPGQQAGVVARAEGPGACPLRLDTRGDALWTGSLACWRAAPGLAPSIGAGPDPDDPKWTEKGGFWVAVATFTVTFLGLGLVLLQLRATQQQGLDDRTLQLVQRYQERDFLETLSSVMIGYLQARDEGECFDRLAAWKGVAHLAWPLVLDPDSERPPPTPSEVQHMANFHEEIGVLFNTKKIGRKQVLRQFPTSLVRAFDRSWWWIHWRRENKLRPESSRRARDYEIERYAEWERMVLKLIEIRPELAPPARERVWIVCVPPKGGGDLEGLRKLSERLSRPLGEIGALIEKLPEAALDAEATRALCVPPWQASRAEHLRVRELAVRLHALLEGPAGYEKLEAIADELPPATPATS